MSGLGDNPITPLAPSAKTNLVLESKTPIKSNEIYLLLESFNLTLIISVITSPPKFHDDWTPLFNKFTFSTI